MFFIFANNFPMPVVHARIRNRTAQSRRSARMKGKEYKGNGKEIIHRSNRSTRGARTALETIVELLCHYCSSFYENDQTTDRLVS